MWRTSTSTASVEEEGGRGAPLLPRGLLGTNTERERPRSSTTGRTTGFMLGVSFIILLDATLRTVSGGHGQSR